MLDMEKSTNRVTDSIERKEKIGILGDYDVDGATSTALLEDTLKLNLPYEIYIPDRKTEGYGPSIKGFKELIAKNVKLIFTVDCGTLSLNQLSLLKKQILML